MDLKNSQLLKDLADGKLPELKTNVTVDSTAIQNIVFGVVLAAVVIILFWKIVK